MLVKGSQKGTQNGISVTNGSIDSKTHEMNRSLNLDESLLIALHQNRYIRWTANDNSYKINSIDWNSSGSHLIISSDESIVRIFDLNGEEVSVIPSKKHGSDCVQWMSDGMSAVFASRYETNNGSEYHKIRHLDINTKTFLHYYCGHEKQVTGISINKNHNCFLSSSEDNTIRLWDSRLSAAIKPGDRRALGVLNTSGGNAAFDPTGVIFAVCLSMDSSIRLYDMRNYTKGPFKVSKLNTDQTFGCVHNLKFSPNGKTLALSTNGSNMKVIDAYTLLDVSDINGFKNDLGMKLELSWTPDSQYLFCGSSASFARPGDYGNINLFNGLNGNHIKTWKTMHEAFTKFIRFNPVHYLLASACHDIAYWCPTQEAVNETTK